MAQTLVTSGTMTNRLDRLEERGLVRRHQDPSTLDRFGCRSPPAGKKCVDRALADLVEREHAILASLSPEDRDVLSGLLVEWSDPLTRDVVEPVDDVDSVLNDD